MWGPLHNQTEIQIFICALFELQDFSPSLNTLSRADPGICNSEKSKSRGTWTHGGIPASFISEWGCVCERPLLLYLSESLVRTALFSVCVALPYTSKGIERLKSPCLGIKEQAGDEAVHLLTWQTGRGQGLHTAQQHALQALFSLETEVPM